MSEHSETLGRHSAQIDNLVDGQDRLEGHIKEIQADIRRVLDVLAERRGERAGIRAAAALWAFIVSAVTSLGAFFAATRLVDRQ